MILNDDQKQALEKIGYIATEPLLTSSELDELCTEVERLRAENEGLALRGNNTFLCDIEAHNALVMRYCTHPKLLQLAMDVLGPDVDLFGSQFAYKQARGGSSFAWHQDSGYGYIVPAEYLTVWLALDDASVENGTIWVMPGSHRWGRLTHTRSASNPNDMIGYDENAEYQGEPVEVQRGCAAAFSSLTLHKSGPNTSDKARRAWVLQYCVPGTHNLRTGHLYSKFALTRGGEPLTMNFIPYEEAALRAWGDHDVIEGTQADTDRITDHARELVSST